MKILQALVCITAVGPMFPVFSQEETRPLLEHSPQADDVVVQLDYRPQMNYGVDRPPLLRIYGDGRTLVHPFSYDARKGPHEMYLQEQDIRELLLYLYDMGLMDFDEQVVTAKKLNVLRERNRAAARRGDGEIQRYVADSSTLVIDVFLLRYRPEGDTAAPIEGFHHQTKWYALLHDAKEYPEVLELAALKEIEGTLMSYTKDEALVPLVNVSPESKEVER